MMQFEDIGLKTKPGKVRYAVICPECNDKREKHKGALCCTINDEPDNRWWNCSHCGWSGNLDVQDRYSKVREESKMPVVYRAYTMKVREYFQSRGISVGIAKKAGLYEMQQGSNIVIGFPYYMHKTLVNVKFLNLNWKKGDKGPKWWQLRKDIGTRIIPFGLQLLKTHDDQGNKYNNTSLILSEGEIDMLTYMECGYPNVSSVPQGAPSLNAKNFDTEFAYLQDKWVVSVLKDIDIIYLSTDNDEAGVKLRGHLAMLLGKDKCRVIRYPVGYKDINEVFAGDKGKGLMAMGKKGVDDCVANAASVPIRGVIKVSDVYEEMNQYREGGFVPGYGCGVPEVDYLFTIKPKLISFITGVPGCFTKDQLVHTNKGVSPISEINPGDYVLSYNHSKDINEYRKVLDVHKFKERSDRLFKIKLKDGTIIEVTEDHEFFTGDGYMEIKQII